MNDLKIYCKTEDDQTNINTVCQNTNFVKVDTDEKLFKNFGPMDKKHESDAIFVSYPGSPGFTRYTRAVVEYTQFIYIYVLWKINTPIANLVISNSKNESIIYYINVFPVMGHVLTVVASPFPYFLIHFRANMASPKST